jgi:hypothetical protein
MIDPTNIITTISTALKYNVFKQKSITYLDNYYMYWLKRVVFIYVCCCPTRFPYKIVVLSFNNNTTGATSAAGNSFISGVFSGLWVAQTLVFCVVFRLPLLNTNNINRTWTPYKTNGRLIEHRFYAEIVADTTTRN